MCNTLQRVEAWVNLAASSPTSLLDAANITNITARIIDRYAVERQE